jgi:6-phosphogluconolactonase/glucosamine-6-phosphate isomerase/deaminase
MIPLDSQEKLRNARTIVVCDANMLAKAAADRVIAVVTANESRTAICLTGGSSLKRLYELLAIVAYRGLIPWDRLHWFMRQALCRHLHNGEERRLSFSRSAESRGKRHFSAAFRSFTNRCLVVILSLWQTLTPHF